MATQKLVRLPRGEMLRDKLKMLLLASSFYKRQDYMVTNIDAMFLEESWISWSSNDFFKIPFAKLNSSSKHICV